MSENDVWHILRARMIVSRHGVATSEHCMIVCTHLTKHQLEMIAKDGGRFQTMRTAAENEILERAIFKKQRVMLK